MFITSQSYTTTPPIMAPSTVVSVDRYDEEVCREIFMNRSQPHHLVRVLVRRSSDERRGIKQSYRAIYGEELLEHLLRIKETNPENEQVCCGLWLWMMEPPERDAVLAKDAVERGSADDYNTIVEIYVRRKSSHLFISKQAYLAKFRGQLDKDIASVWLEHLGSKILQALATSHRSHHDEMISQHIANCDAKRLNEALKRSEGGIDESSIIEIFSKRSMPQLTLAFSTYKHIYGNDFIEALEKRSGDFEDSLRVVIQCMCAPYKYYSEGSLLFGKRLEMNYSKYSNSTPAQDAHDYAGSSLNRFNDNALKNYCYCCAPTKMIHISTLPQVCGKKQALVLFEAEEQATEALVCKYASNIDGTPS